MFLTQDNQIKWKKLAWFGFATAILIALGISYYDQPLYLFLRQFDCRLWRIFDAIFDAKIWLIVAFSCYAVFCVKKLVITKLKYRNNRNRFSLFVLLNDFFVKTKNSYAFLIFCSIFGASIVGKFLKIMIGRARPIFYEALDMVGFFPFSTEWAFNSMPSGHAAASFAGLVMIGLLAPRAKWFTWTLTIVIGLSRVCVGAHWPTDVLFGAFIGMVSADLVKATIKYHNEDNN